jgi:hypothetical protein
MRHVSCFLALALASAAYADDEHLPVKPIPAAAPWLTGAQLLQRLGRPTEAAAAEDYIQGVHDATEHKDWCYAGPNGKPLPKQRPVDLQTRILAGLRALPQNQLKRNAAQLVVEIWQDKWPCPPDGCCQ